MTGVDLETVACALCGSNDSEPLFKSVDQRYTTTPRNEFTLVECRGCGLRYLNPRPTEASLSLFYPEAYYSDRPLRSRDRGRSWLRRIYPSRAGRILREKVDRSATLLQEGGRLLEVGPAAGEFLVAMRRRGFEGVGVERSESMLRRLRDELSIECYRPGELEPGTLAPFHLIVLWNTFEHLSDPAGFLRWARGLLVPGGALLFSAPNAQALERTLFYRGHSCEDVPRHLFSFSPDTVSRLLEKAGFDSIRISHATRVATSELQDRVEATFLRGRSGLPARKIVYNVGVLPLIWAWDRLTALGGRGHTMIVAARVAR